MKKNVLMVLFRFGIALSGCAMFVSCASSFSASASSQIVPFTDEILMDIGGEDNITKFQYYLSEGILLSRVTEEGSAALSGGAAVISKRKTRNEIEILPSTQCAAIEYYVGTAGLRYLSVAFEGDNDDGTTPTIEFMQASDREQYILSGVTGGVGDQFLKYNNETYKITRPDGTNLIHIAGDKAVDDKWPFLNIKYKKSDIETSQRRTVSGRQVK